MSDDVRCLHCDLPLPTAAQWETMRGGEGVGLCWAAGACRGARIDWRGRALAAEAEVTRLTEALRFLCRADVCRCDFCGAAPTKRDPSEPLAWWCDVCAPPDAVDHEHAATLRPLLPPRGKPQWGER